MSTKITKIGITNDKISAPGGLPLFLRYIEKIGFYRLVSGIILPVILKSSKGLQLQQFIKQNLTFFMDGTHMAISGFDQIKEDDGYAAFLECRKDHLASSHQIKRYFAKLSCITNFIFNKVLHELFLLVYWMKNDIKTPVIMKKHPENHIKKLILDSFP